MTGMTMPRLLPLALLALAACSDRSGGNAAAPNAAAPDHAKITGMDMGATAPAPNDTPATRLYKESMATMMTAMPDYTQDADIDFNRQMKVHHQAAIAMAEAQLAYGKDPASTALSKEIIAAQRKEIARIDAWLAQRR